MPMFFHAVPCFAFRQMPLTLQCVLVDEAHTVAKLSLCYEWAGERYCKRMLPHDGFLAGESYSVYEASIPAEHLEGESFSYSFDFEGGTREIYTVPLFDLPALPPFLITEHASEMRWDAHYYEVCNPTAERVDLYDYEIVLEEGGEETGRNTLADLPGENLLDGGEVAVLRFLVAERLNRFGDAERDTADFLRSLSVCFPVQCEELPQHPPRILYSTLAAETKEGWRDRPGTFAISQNGPHRLHIVKRGAGIEHSLYRMELNLDGNSFDVPARLTSLWSFDFRAPHLGYRIATQRPATPGYADEGQAFPFVGDCTVPAILPLFPSGAVYLGNGALRVRFVTFTSGGCTPHVYLCAADGVRSFAASLTDDGVWEVTVPYDLLCAQGTELRYYIEARGGMYSASLGSESAPLVAPIIDNAGPAIHALYPADGEAVEEERPTVCVRFSDPSGVNLSTSMLCLDGFNVSDTAKWTENGVTFRPAKALSMGEHVLEITLRDTLGNRAYSRTAFVVHDGKELSFYRGEVHAHTADSDGSGTVEQAMAYARDVGKVDYFAITDHCCYLTIDDVMRQKAVADRYNKHGEFAALYGYEVGWGKEFGFFGHMNVLNPGSWFAPAASTTLPELYAQLEEHPDAVAMFNHPCDRWGNFGNYAHRTPTVDRRVCLAEIKRAEFDPEYALLLARGWHAAPVANEDNHQMDWTTKTQATGVVLAHSLTRENVLDAFRRGRTYSTMDNTMRIRYRVNGKWLGTRLKRPKKLLAEIEITTERAQGIGEIALVAEDNIVVASVKAGPRKTFFWKIELDPNFDYYYLKITNGQTYSVTSPVYVEGWDDLAIADMRAGVSDDPAQPHAVGVTVENRGGLDMSEVCVDFYLTPSAGFALRTLLPFARLPIGRLAAGERREVCAAFPCVAGNRRVTAIVSGMGGKHRFVDTRYLSLTPLTITKVCASTSPEGEVKNPFAYVELYNPLCIPVSLEAYHLRARILEGDHRPNSEIRVPLENVEIPPKGTVTVWSRPDDCALDVGDFNTRYGTELEKDTELLVAPHPFLIDDRFGHFVDICCGEERLDRAEWGDYYGGAASALDRCEYHRPANDITITSQRFCPEAPTPIGVVSAAQSLPLMALDEQENEQNGAEQTPVVTKLVKAPLNPIQGAAFLASAFNTFKNLFSEKD